MGCPPHTLPQILILIDALDEGDPPEQQAPGFKGGVMAGGNKALALVARLLADKLPHNHVRSVRDCITEVQDLAGP